MTEDELLTIPELAKRWKVSRQTIYRRMQSGQLPYVEVAGLRRIHSSVVRALERGEQPPGPEDTMPPPTPLRKD